MESIQKLNEELKEQGEMLEPCEFLHECMENFDERSVEVEL